MSPFWTTLLTSQQPARVDERHKRGSTRDDGTTKIGGDTSCSKRQRNNQPDKRYERGAMRGGMQ